MLLRKFEKLSSVGDRLYTLIPNLMCINDYNLIKEIPFEYKSYTKIIRETLAVKFRFGGEVTDIFRSIKKGLIKDIQFQKKFESARSQTLLQMFLMMVIIWGFIFVFHKVTKVEVNKHVLAFILSINLIGFYFFISIQKKILNNFTNKYENPLIIFMNLLFRSQVGMAPSIALKESGVEKLEQLCPKELANYRFQIQNAIHSWKNLSIPISHFQNDIFEEYWFVIEQQFSKALKKVLFLQFAVGVIFFIPSYFIFISSFFAAILIN
ncbi:hypothetical protein OAT67_03975 [Bacteriovoracaceae bacterium]|nr:hypothetical protein [Bacteriovoracaceae bacterium]